jgi:hypothetical protein
MEGKKMLLLNPIDLAEPMVDFSEIDPATMGTYTFNGGKRSDSDVDGFSGNVGSWDPRSPKGTVTNNGGRPSDHD